MPRRSWRLYRITSVRFKRQRLPPQPRGNLISLSDTLGCGQLSKRPTPSRPLPSAAHGAAKGVPAHGPAVVLFNGSDLSNFDTFLKSTGLNADPKHVFQVEHGVIHISGQEFGYIITKQEYRNCYLRAEFKWGEGTYAPREGQARDSGILYNIQGPQRVWPRSIEFQINEGATGDFWMTDGAALTGKDGNRVTGPDGKASKIDRFGKGPWQNVVGYRDPAGEVEKPHGEWNVVELSIRTAT